MNWVRLLNCKVVRKGGRLFLICEGAKLEESEKRPQGVEVNEEFATGTKGMSFLDFLSASYDGEFFVGDLRPGVGGAFVIPFRMLYFGANSDEVQRILDSLCIDFGFVREVMIAVVRGRTAPGTVGIDGGGAGILNVYPETPEVVSVAAFKEVFGEIAIIEGDTGIVIGLKESGSLGRTIIEQINAEIAKELQISHGLKIGAHYADVQLLANPDGMIIGDPKNSSWVLDDIALAFERKNASVEITRIFNLMLKPGARYRFLDLEHDRNGKLLAPGGRQIAAICHGEKLFSAYYHGGYYMDGVPTNLSERSSLLTSTNEKCRKLLWLLHWTKAGDLQ